MNHRKVISPTSRAGLLALLAAIAVLAAVLTSTPMATQAQAPAVTGVSVQPGANAGGLDVSWATHPGETKDYRVAWAPQGENFRKWSNTDWNAYPTGTSLTITGLQGGATYKVKVRARFDEGPSSPWSAVMTATARLANGAATGQPTVSGTALVGETLTARTSAISDDNGMTSAVFSYQWVRTGAGTDNDVAGATGSTYELSTDDLSHTIKVRVSFTDDDGYSEELTSEPTAVVLSPPNTTPMGLPVTSGTLQVGKTLTADTSGISDLNGMTEAVFAFQWVRTAGGTDADIPDATGSTYDLSTDDLSHTMKVRVSFTDDDGYSEALTSESTGIVLSPPNATPSGLPVISGTLEVGQTLTAGTSGIADLNGMTEAVFAFQWVRTAGDTDTDIPDATGSTYELSTDDLSHTIKVRVSFTDDDGYSETLTSESTNIVLRPPNATPGGLPAISGTLEVGETLTADTSGIADLNGMTQAVFAFQWIRTAGGTDTDIPDATGSSHTIVSSDAGNRFKVRVSFTDDDGYAESVTSQATDILLVVQQQTAATLVSNTGQTTTSSRYAVGPRSGSWYSRALQFTAGSATNGYTITEVSIRLKRIRAGAVPRVSIYTSVNAPGTLVALPGTLVFTFTNPDSFSNGLNTFTAPANSTLAGSADYFVVIENAATGDAATNRYDVRVTNQRADDTGGATGWSLGDTRIDRPANGADWVDTSQLDIPQVAIKGAAIESTAPALSAATVDGTSLVLTYNEPLDEGSVPATSAYSVTVGSNSAAAPSAVAVSGLAVTLTLAKAAASGDTVTLTYTVPSSDPVQDAAGNDAAALNSQAVTNDTADTTAPALSAATVYGTSLVLTYDEPLDEDSVPATSAYSVTVGSNSAAAPSTVSISGSTVTLTLAKAAASGDTVTLTYTVPSSNPVQDAAGNDAAALSS